MNHAAFAPEDVDDARRGHPAVDLSGYAQARGLAVQGQGLAGHFGGLNPDWPDYVFNSLRGEVVPGRFGIIQHELYEIALGDDGEPYEGGAFYGRRTVATPGLRGLIGLHKAPPDEPFAAQAMWVPTTSVKLLVPEAALVPRLVIKKRNPPSFTARLGDEAPSFGLASGPGVTDELRAAVSASIGPVLEWLGTPFCRLEVAYGALSLTVNGYRSDPGWLDALVRAAASIAQSCVDLGRPWWVEAPFEAPLGPFDASTHPEGYVSFAGWLDSSGLETLQLGADRFGMTVEDPVALHRRFPRLPIPGTSRGVLSGVLQGTDTFGRLTWQFQNYPSSAVLRGGVLVAARPDAPATPVGGFLDAETDLYVAVVDGVACCWWRGALAGRLDAELLMSRAVAVLRRTGLAPI